MAIRTYRRYLRLKLEAAAMRMDYGLVGAWAAKLEANPGTPLAEDFPGRQKLAEAGYTALEDLDGATADELAAVKGLGASVVGQVLEAVATLTGHPVAL